MKEFYNFSEYRLLEEIVKRKNRSNLLMFSSYILFIVVFCILGITNFLELDFLWYGMVGLIVLILIVLLLFYWKKWDNPYLYSKVVKKNDILELEQIKEQYESSEKLGRVAISKKYIFYLDTVVSMVFIYPIIDIETIRLVEKLKTRRERITQKYYVKDITGEKSSRTIYFPNPIGDKLELYYNNKKKYSLLLQNTPANNIMVKDLMIGDYLVTKLCSFNQEITVQPMKKRMFHLIR